MSAEANCLFCKMVRGEIPVKEVYQDEDVLAFHDIGPQAPTHILVIPKRHISSLATSSPEDEVLLGRMLGAVRDIARTQGIADDGYRCVLNTGERACQSVFHIHAHLLAGRDMAWPPG